jgi:hypothetical protein
MNVRICLAALMAASAATASAGIVSVSGGIQELAVAPFSVQQGAVENDAHGFAFVERESYVLPVSLQLDISTSGVFNEAVELTPQAIAAGTRINSYFVHVDTTSTRILQGSLILAEPILGIELLENALQSGHPVVGNPATVYPVNNSNDALAAPLDFAGGTQFSDTMTVNGPAKRVEFYVGSTSISLYEHFRIITAASVPEPSSGLLMLGGLAAVALRHRR